jgi:hypothetical protein
MTDAKLDRLQAWLREWKFEMDDAAADAIASLRAERDARAGWLAQYVIDHMGGTNDLPAWVKRSADHYAEALAEAERAEADAARYVTALQEFADWTEAAAKDPMTFAQNALAAIAAEKESHRGEG